MMEKRWHGSVGFELTDRYGTHCGYVGLAYPCESQEDGWCKGLEWLRSYRGLYGFLIHSFKLDVRYF